MKKRFLLRVETKLWDEIERWARDELRSVNGQIEYILRQAVERRKRGARDGGAAFRVSDGGDKSEERNQA